ncbi:MAG: hypothetical protein AAF392_03635 [Bacteroidota bacterium]
MASKATLRNPVAWYLDFELYYTFEVALELLEPFLPQGVAPMEIRPHTGLIGMEAIGFTEDNFIDREQFAELSFSACVHADLRFIGTNLPKSAFLPLHIAANSSSFLDYAASADNIPVYKPKNLQLAIDYDQYTLSCADESGDIVELAVPTTIPQSASFEKKTLEIQLFIIKNKKLYATCMTWSGKIFESQADDIGKKCSINDRHSFFKGINMKDPARNCYMVWMSPPRDRHKVTYHQPVEVRGLA